MSALWQMCFRGRAFFIFSLRKEFTVREAEEIAITGRATGAQVEPHRYLSAPQVCRRYGISDMTLWRWLRDEKMAFPEPMVRNRRRYFLEADLAEWERQRVTAA